MTISATTQGIKPGVCTSTNRPAAPFDGQVIYMTDVDQTAVWDGTQWTVLAPIAGGRNAVINGNMDVWQRGTSFTISTGVVTYTADRWQQYFNGGGTITQETTVKPATSLFSLKMTATATSGDNAIYQLVEEKNMAKFKGKTVTLSVKLAGTATINPGINLAYSTTADDFLTNTGTQATVVSTTSPAINASTFVTYTRTFTVPTTAKTLRIGINSGSMVNTNVLYVAEVQLEAGAVATPFEFEDYSKTLAKCQRYYEAGTNLWMSAYGVTSAILDTRINEYVSFNVTKRSAPTVTLSSITKTNETLSGGAIWADPAVKSGSNTVTGFSLHSKIGTAAGTAHCEIQIGSWNASAEL